jgi:uncharacterized protein (DUF1330 family)
MRGRYLDQVEDSNDDGTRRTEAGGLTTFVHNPQGRADMAKGYWITFYRSISDPAALAAYGKLAGPAIIANGGRFLARGDAAKAYEQGIAQRATVTEFDSVEHAVAAHDSPAYREALKALGNACERDVRIVEGLD